MPDWVLPLVTLTAMEVILGIDNIIFVAIVVGKLPPEQQRSARLIGLSLALAMRLLLLLAIRWVMTLEHTTLFTLPALPFLEEPAERVVTAKDAILIAGGLFLIAKTTFEIHDKIEGGESASGAGRVRPAGGYWGVIGQVIALDLVFSLDSVITAVGLVQQVWVMVVAMLVAVGAMIAFAGSVAGFIDRHPTIKMLALAFLILIGVLLVAEGFGQHLDRGYIYFAMFFSAAVELLNMKVRKKAAPAET